MNVEVGTPWCQVQRPLVATFLPTVADGGRQGASADNGTKHTFIEIVFKGTLRSFQSTFFSLITTLNKLITFDLASNCNPENS